MSASLRPAGAGLRTTCNYNSSILDRPLPYCFRISHCSTGGAMEHPTYTYTHYTYRSKVCHLKPEGASSSPLSIATTYTYVHVRIRMWESFQASDHDRLRAETYSFHVLMRYPTRGEQCGHLLRCLRCRWTEPTIHRVWQRHIWRQRSFPKPAYGNYFPRMSMNRIVAPT